MTARKYTLLIIAPSSTELDKIISILRSGDYQIIPVSGVQEAIKQIKQCKVDLVLHCLDFPDSKECHIMRQLRGKDPTIEIPVILISSINNEDIVSECLNYSYTDFIARPLRPKELLLRIRHQLSLLDAKRTIREQNRQLKKTMESRDKMYSIIAHDLRSPIGTIKMINAAIEQEKDKISDSGIRQKFEMINETTEEAFSLLENLLRWSRNKQGNTKVILEKFDISGVIREIFSLFTSIANAKNIQLHNQVLSGMMVRADEDMIKTVLRNLLSNAIKFTYPGGDVWISAQENEHQITIEVKDNGQGIKKEHQPGLLQADHHLTTHGTKNEKGSGLGLLLSKDFIKRNKGKIWFTSEEGTGTTFSFTVPKASRTGINGLPVPRTCAMPPRHQ